MNDDLRSTNDSEDKTFEESNEVKSADYSDSSLKKITGQMNEETESLGDSPSVGSLLEGSASGQLNTLQDPANDETPVDTDQSSPGYRPNSQYLQEDSPQQQGIPPQTEHFSHPTEVPPQQPASYQQSYSDQAMHPTQAPPQQPYPYQQPQQFATSSEYEEKPKNQPDPNQGQYQYQQSSYQYGTPPAGQGPPPYPQQVVYVTNTQTQMAPPAPATRNDSAYIVGFLLAILLGVYGVSYMMNGKVGTGIAIMLLMWFVWAPIAVAIIIGTLGFGACVIIPVNILLAHFISKAGATPTT